MRFASGHACGGNAYHKTREAAEAAAKRSARKACPGNPPVWHVHELKNPAAAAKGGKAPAPAAKKPAGKGEVEKPVVDVPKLEVPKIQEYTTQTGHKYLIERSIPEIS
jgi:hypothetical protein